MDKELEAQVMHFVGAMLEGRPARIPVPTGLSPQLGLLQELEQHTAVPEAPKVFFAQYA